jgi:hypothetical protein
VREKGGLVPGMTIVWNGNAVARSQPTVMQGLPVESTSTSDSQ